MKTSWRNRVFRRAESLARQGKWFACDLVLLKHLWNAGESLTPSQSKAIRRAKERQVYATGDTQLADAGLDNLI